MVGAAVVGAAVVGAATSGAPVVVPAPDDDPNVSVNGAAEDDEDDDEAGTLQ